jgi:alpha-N-acetylglucosaminidase
MRWSAYFKALNDEMEAKSKPDIEKLGSGKYKGLSTDELFRLALEQEVKLDFYAMEEPWTLQHNVYTSAPEGDVIVVAKDVCEKYLYK